MVMQTTDILTGLKSRSAFVQALDDALAAGERFGLVHLDIDEFALVNYYAGIPQGEQALRDVAASLSRLDCDVARYAGDEFAVLVLNGDAAAVAGEAWRAATGALAAYDTPGLHAHAVEINRLYREADARRGEPPRAERTLEQPALGATVVVLQVADHREQNSNDLLQRVEAALQAAKAGPGRNRVNPM